MHCSLKKRAQNGAVLNDTVAFLLPLDAQKTGEEESFVPLFSPTSLPLKSIKKTPTKDPHLPKTFHLLEGRQHSGRPVLFLPYFSPIKTWEGRAQKREKGEDRRKKRREKREKRRRKGKKKKEKKTEEEEGEAPPATNTATATAAPPSPAAPPRRHPR
jgi:hypothetical protein